MLGWRLESVGLSSSLAIRCAGPPYFLEAGGSSSQHLWQQCTGSDAGHSGCSYWLSISVSAVFSGTG